MSDALAKAVEKLGTRFDTFQTKDFPDFRVDMGERLAGVETNMKGVQGRLKKIEAKHSEPPTIAATLPARGDDSTSIEVPQHAAIVKVKRPLPWELLLRLAVYFIIGLLCLGAYMKSDGSPESSVDFIEALNAIAETTREVEKQVEILSAPVGEPAVFVNESVDVEAMAGAVQ